MLLTYRLPSGGSRARVAVWREIRRSGALHLQQSVVAFPDAPRFREAVAGFRKTVDERGGTTLALGAEPLEPEDEQALRDQWNALRKDEYAELAAECRKLVAEIEKEIEKGKLTPAELEEEEAELEKLVKWHARIRDRDVLDAGGGDEAAAVLREATAAVERFSEAVFDEVSQ